MIIMVTRMSVQETPLSSFTQASEWDTSRTLQAERSERRAWMVAGAFGVGFLLSCGAIALMLPLKETTPYVVRVDNATGVPDIVTVMKDQIVTGEDVMTKYWLAKYIIHRETYDWHTLQSDYDTTGLLSSEVVGAEYGEQFSGSDALTEQYGDRIQAHVQVVSVVPTGDNTGTVRFIKTTKRLGNNSVIDSKQWVATVAFEFRNTERVTETVRLVNPFGFRVTSYRVDPEMVSSN